MMFFGFGHRGFGACHSPMCHPPFFRPIFLPGCGCLGCLFPVLGVIIAITMVLRLIFWF